MFIFVLLYRVCTHVRMGILAKSLCVYVCVVVESMYTCETGNFSKDTSYLCFGCCRGYVHM